MIELVIAVFILSIALLALMAGYDSAFVSLHSASHKSAASTLADAQLELYNALTYTAVGLDQATLTTTKASDTVYVADENGLDNHATATDATISGCGTTSATPQCLPVQTVTGNDRHVYKVETFVRNVTGIIAGRAERIVTVIVRDPGATGAPVLVQMSAGFDAGPS